MLDSKMNNSTRIHDFLKYLKSSSFSLDDFMRGVDAWSLEWLHRDWQSPIKETLLISYYYLRLYLNSFAFSATLIRASSNADEDGPAPVFKNGIGTLPDGRFITNAVDAASSLIRECDLLSLF